MKKINHKSGFTLVELIVVIALLSIVGILMSRLMYFSASQNTRINQEIESNQETRLILDYITAEVRRHDAVNNISFQTINGETMLQIHDTETPFVVEGTEFSYEVMRAVTVGTGDDAYDKLSVAFGNDINDFSSASTTWYDVVASKYIKTIELLPQKALEDPEYPGDTDKYTLKAFDVSVTYWVSESLQNKITETITIRSEK